MSSSSLWRAADGEAEGIIGAEKRSPRRSARENLFFWWRRVTLANASTKRPFVAPMTRLLSVSLGSNAKRGWVRYVGLNVHFGCHFCGRFVDRDVGERGCNSRLC